MNATEYEARVEKLKRRQEMAHMLQAQGMSAPQGQMVSGRYVAPSLFASLAPLLGAAAGTYAGSKADKESEDLESAHGADITKAIDEYTNATDDTRKQALGTLLSTTSKPQDAAKLLVAKAMGAANQQRDRFNVGNALIDRDGNVIYQSPGQDGPKIGNYNPGDFTPESFDKFMVSKKPSDLVRWVAPANPTVKTIGGVETLVTPDRNTGTAKTSALSTLDAEKNAASELARSKGIGEATGKAEGGIVSKATSAQSVIDLLNAAEPLIDQSTGSAAGAGVDKAAGLLGSATEGAKAIAQLKVLQAGLVQNMPRLEGPQSDADRAAYVDAAGAIADPTVPRDIRKAAMRTIRSIQEKYQSRLPAGSAAPAPPGNRPPLSSFMSQ